jgi:hypothetical protein
MIGMRFSNVGKLPTYIRIVYSEQEESSFLTNKKWFNLVYTFYVGVTLFVDIN